METQKQGAHTGRLPIQIPEHEPPGTWRRFFPQIVPAIHRFRGR